MGAVGADGESDAALYQQMIGDAELGAKLGYDAAWAAIKAMQAAGSTKPDAYRPKLQSIGFDGITGHIAFNPDGSLKNGSSTMYQVKGGQFVTIVTKGGS